ANDLRHIVSALKISSDLERIGDYAKNVSKRAVALAQFPPVKPVYAIPRMAKLVQEMIKEILDAYTAQDAAKAVAAWQRDEEVDEMYTSLFRELLTYMMEDQRNITPSIHLLFIAKNIERMGDHATNVAEDIHFLVLGRPIDSARPNWAESRHHEPHRTRGRGRNGAGDPAALQSGAGRLPGGRGWRRRGSA